MGIFSDDAIKGLDEAKWKLELRKPLRTKNGESAEKLSERVLQSWWDTKSGRKKMKKKKSRGETAAQRGKFLSAIFPNRTVINPRLLFHLTAAVLLWHTRREKQKRRAKHKKNRENKQTVFHSALKI